jgi:hypothetical protein
MSTTRRVFVKKAVAVTSGLAAVVFVPRIAFAGCSSSTRSYEFNHDGVVNIEDWKLGDCELKQASLHVSGNFIILNSQVCTHFTHTKDVWHITAQVFYRDNANPTKEIVVATGKMDGPQMSEQDHPLFHTWNARFGFNPALVSGRRFAVNITSCC